MSTSTSLSIAVIAKECLPGKVKTRLSPPLTPAGAAQVAQASLSRTLDTVRGLPAVHRLLVMDGTPASADADQFDVVPQAGGGLDERLAAVCDAVPGPLLILGMDTPQFSQNHLAALLADWGSGLPAQDAWLGPAADGGFWALAMRRPDGNLIRGIPMSTDRTGAAQLDRLESAGLCVGQLPLLRDMDHFSDAMAIAREIPGTAFAAVVETMARAGALR